MVRRLTIGFSLLTLVSMGYARGDEARGVPKGSQAHPISYVRDVRPILSDNCFACHGPDDHEAEGRAAAGHEGGAFAQARERQCGGRARQAG